MFLPSTRARFRGPLLGCLLALALATSAFAQDATVTLLHINDVYEIAPVKGQGGLAELMTLLRQERAQHANTITTVGGDFLSPSVLSGITKGAQMVELFGALGVDLVTFGNHEFDFGPEILEQRIAESRFPWLGTNVRDTDDKPFGGAVATVIKTVGDVRIGFLGIVTPESAVLSSAGPGIRFTDPAPTANAAGGGPRPAGAPRAVSPPHLGIPEGR